MKKFNWNTPRTALDYICGAYWENKYYVQIFISNKKAYIGICNYDCKPVYGERRKYIIDKVKRYLNRKYKVHYGMWEKDL